jgi:hypothetical protein
MHRVHFVKQRDPGVIGVTPAATEFVGEDGRQRIFQRPVAQNRAARGRAESGLVVVDIRGVLQDLVE